MKPAALGGAERTLALTDRAHANGVRAVISSSFESPLGLANLVHLAQAVDTRASQGCAPLPSHPSSERSFGQSGPVLLACTNQEGFNPLRAGGRGSLSLRRERSRTLAEHQQHGPGVTCLGSDAMCCYSQHLGA
eukprot:707475-Pyramimonas_sp.AAC.1